MYDICTERERGKDTQKTKQCSIHQMWMGRREGVKNHEIVVMSFMEDPLNEWTNCEDNSGISFPSPVQLLGNRLTNKSSIFGYLHLIKYVRERGRDTK